LAFKTEGMPRGMQNVFDTHATRGVVEIDWISFK